MELGDEVQTWEYTKALCLFFSDNFWKHCDLKCTILYSLYFLSWPLYPFRSHREDAGVYPSWMLVKACYTPICLQLSRALFEPFGDSLPCSRVGWWCSEGVLATLLYSQNSFFRNWAWTENLLLRFLDFSSVVLFCSCWFLSKMFLSKLQYSPCSHLLQVLVNLGKALL